MNAKGNFSGTNDLHGVVALIKGVMELEFK